MKRHTTIEQFFLAEKNSQRKMLFPESYNSIYSFHKHAVAHQYHTLTVAFNLSATEMTITQVFSIFL